MMRNMAIMGVLLLAAGTAGAADSDTVDCSKAITQYDLNVCADKDTQAADKALNSAYRKVTALQDDKASKDRLIAAERAWMAYRDAQCTFETADSEGGSIHPMEYSICLTKETKARTKELESYLACQKDAAKC
jgi:uncharacterized protein YecT (DUF1311 family)